MNRASLFALIALVLAGCGQSRSHVPVTGTVKYGDGTVPQGDISSVTFQPSSPLPGAKGAAGNIGPDGAFELRTVKPGDGALPGDYKVTIHVTQGYPNGKSMVAKKFTSHADTPLTASVTAGDDNHFDFTVERP